MIEGGAFEAKLSADKWFPIRLVDATDGYSEETGIAFGDVTAKYGYEADTGGMTAYSVDATNWKETGDGNYWISIGASEFSTSGKYTVRVAATGCRTVVFNVEVRSYTFEEWYTGTNIVDLKLKQIDINNAYGTALLAKSTGSNGVGFDILGNGTGEGMVCKGGNSHATGMKIESGTIYGIGVDVQGGNIGINVQGRDDVNPAYALNCHVSSADGQGVRVSGGVSSGDAIYIDGRSGHGINVRGNGSGSALYLRQTASSPALKITGGTTGFASGVSAVLVQAMSGTDSHGVEILGYGTGDGISVEGGSGGGDGISATGGDSGPGTVAGNAIRLTGSTTSGAGQTAEQGNGIFIKEQSQLGHGIHSDATGTGGKGIYAKSANSVAAQFESSSLFGSLFINNTNINAPAVNLSGGANANDIQAKEIGTPVALDGGSASLAGMLTKIADDNGGLDFNSAYDSLHEMGDENIKINYLYDRVGIPVALDGGSATVSGMMVKIADDYGGSQFNAEYDSLNSMPNIGDLKDLLFTRSVTNRHANEKPQIVQAGKGTNQVTVTTTIDGSGNVETESHS